MQETATVIDIEAPAPAPAPHGAEEDEDVREVPAAAPPEKQMNYEKNGRGELIFQQVIGVGVKAFMTDRANIKPGRDGKGGVQYNKKEVWDKEILPPLKAAEEFKGAAWPADHQSVLSWVERTVKKNSHLYKSGQEQAEPADAGTEGTKDERPLTPFQQVCMP